MAVGLFTHKFRSDIARLAGLLIERSSRSWGVVGLIAYFGLRGRNLELALQALHDLTRKITIDLELLDRGGKVVKSGDAQLSDKSYGNRIDSYPSDARLPAEKQMIDDWWRAAVQPERAADR